MIPVVFWAKHQHVEHPFVVCAITQLAVQHTSAPEHAQDGSSYNSLALCFCCCLQRPLALHRQAARAGAGSLACRGSAACEAAGAAGLSCAALDAVCGVKGLSAVEGLGPAQGLTAPAHACCDVKAYGAHPTLGLLHDEVSLCSMGGTLATSRACNDLVQPDYCRALGSLAASCRLVT